MVKKIKKSKESKAMTRHEREEERDRRKKMGIGLFMLAIMVLSVAGFALMTGLGSGTSPNGNNVPREIPLQQFTDPATGQVFWGAIKNGEQFVFLDVGGFEDFTNLKVLSEQIKSKNTLNVYIDANFSSSDAVYNIEKALGAFDVIHSRIQNATCDSNTIVLTNENIFEGECLVFEAPQGEEGRYSEALLYNMLK